MQKIRSATLVALAAGGLACWGAGIAVADGHGHGAQATGGSAVGTVFQQNTAQAHKQNNNCSHWNGMPRTALTGGRVETRCTAGDASVNKHTVTKGGGARATGGSSASTVFQQNTAQEGRQNNTCANPNATGITVTGGRAAGQCANHDGSRNRLTVVKAGGAHATGGSSASTVFQQNTAQEGRQNNTCTPNATGITVTGGRAAGQCANHDGSRNHHTLVKSGGAHATGGSSTGTVFQQNTAQEGRQNNTCTNPDDSFITVTGGRVEDHCSNLDHSRNHHIVVRGGGAHATGGSNTVSVVNQQNTAQRGRQNNACGNLNDSGIAVTGGRVAGHCANHDGSRNHHTLVKSGGAHATGGSNTVGAVDQQNTAQEGRQNNACGNLNDSVVIVRGGRAAGHCGTHDGSRNHHTLVKSGGAHATGGSSTGGRLDQQNTAQEGRQNNACANPNHTFITLTGSDTEVGCQTIDRSTSVGTAEISHGAEAEGGSSVADLFQQNTAQEGRQNNNCGNPNDLTLTASVSRTRTQCLAADTSKNIGSIDR